MRGAGHEVPLSQPKRALILFKSFLAGKELPILPGYENIDYWLWNCQNYLDIITKENWLSLSNLLSVIVSWFVLIYYKSKISASIYGTRSSPFQVTNPINKILTVAFLPMAFLCCMPYRNQLSNPIQSLIKNQKHI